MAESDSGFLCSSPTISSAILRRGYWMFRGRLVLPYCPHLPAEPV